MLKDEVFAHNKSADLQKYMYFNKSKNNHNNNNPKSIKINTKFKFACKNKHQIKSPYAMCHEDARHHIKNSKHATMMTPDTQHKKEAIKHTY